MTNRTYRSYHRPVLLKEVIQYLKPQEGDDFIDATFGEGGHALEILKRIMPGGKLLGIDWDYGINPPSLRFESELRKGKGSSLDTGSENLIASEPLASRRNVGGIRSGIESGSLPENLLLAQGNFADIADIASRLSFDEVDGNLFDFGFSSSQLQGGETGGMGGRGFSYPKD